MMPGSPQVMAAYRYCEAVTERQARNFAYGIRLLPPAQRLAMCAIYALARRVDDIGDGTLPDPEKRRRLGETRELVRAIRECRVEEDATDPVAVALAHTAARFPIPLDAFDELVEGVEMDLAGTEYATWEQLRRYCLCVAGTVGRLTIGVVGARDPEHAASLADTLGLALQLTNILRDLREDAENGRTYLPAEDLERFGVEGFAKVPLPPGADFAGLMDFEVRRARALFDEGLTLLPLLPRRGAACVTAMAGIYHRLLERIAAEPDAVLHGRVSLPGWEKAYVAFEGLAQNAWGGRR